MLKFKFVTPFAPEIV